MALKVDGIGHGDPNNEKIKPEVRTSEINNFYLRLKSGQPLIGNMLNGSNPVPSDTAAANL